ncbi:hypothetical protein [Streptomyces griseochromogenes]|uniref:hypothetical protein n=1 Tax=Streptomyces griseochromogenes TaxID=68214 RepID=UPI0037ACB2E0
MTALAAGLAGYGLTTASTASAADNTTSASAKDCVKAGAAARFSFKPICPATPPSATEEAVNRGFNAFMSFGVSELFRAAHTTNDGRGQEGCTSAGNARFSTKPLCKPRELTGTEKALRDLAVGALLPSPAKFAPSAIQDLNTLRAAGAGVAQGAKKADSMLHNGSGTTAGGQKSDDKSPQASGGASSQGANNGPLMSPTDWDALRASNGVPWDDLPSQGSDEKSQQASGGGPCFGSPLEDVNQIRAWYRLPPIDNCSDGSANVSSQTSDNKSRPKRDASDDASDLTPGQTSDPSQSGDGPSQGAAEVPGAPELSSEGTIDGGSFSQSGDGTFGQSPEVSFPGSDDGSSAGSDDSSFGQSDEESLGQSDDGSFPVADVSSFAR